MMKKLLNGLIVACVVFLAACTPAVVSTSIPIPVITRETQVSPLATATSRSSTVSPTPTLINTQMPTLTSTATVVLPTIAMPTPHPLALDLSNAAADMKKMADFGRGAVRDAAWSPDGKTLAVASESGVYFYNTQTWAEVGHIPDATVVCLMYSPDGEFLALAKHPGTGLFYSSTDSDVLLWNTKSQSFERQMDGKLEGRGDKLVYDSAGHIAAVGVRGSFGGSTGYVKAWDASTGKEIFARGDILLDTTPVLVDYLEGDAENLIAVGLTMETGIASPDAALLADVQTGALVVREAKNDKEIATFDFDQIDVLAAALVDVDGSQRYLAATGGAQVMLWDLETGALIQKMASLAPTIALDFSPDRRTLALLDENGLLRLWDIPSGKQTYMFDLAGQVGRKMKFSPDGTAIIFAGNYDQTLLEFDLQSNQLTVLHTASDTPPADFDAPFFYTPKAHLMSWGYKGKNGGLALTLLDFSSGEETETSYVAVSDYSDFVEELTVNPAGNLVAFAVPGSGGEPDPAIHIYDLQKQEIVRSMKTGGEAAQWDGGITGTYNLVFSPISDLLVSGGYDGVTRLWNVHTGNPLRILNSTHKQTVSTAFTPDGRFLVVTDGSFVNVWGIPAE